MRHKVTSWHRMIAPGVLGSVVALAAQWPAAAVAYERYNDGCNDCHGAFTDGTSPQGTVFPSNDKHRMHRHDSYMATECDLCHTDGDDRDPFIGSSNGTEINPGAGCTGCHGRDYGGTLGNSGVGLRAHHALNNITICGVCHFSDPVPLPESFSPTYYGTADTQVGDPCNSGPGYQENWSIGDTQGQDTDGDNWYDGADGDCCPGDLDHDAQVSLNDLAQLLGGYGATGATYEDGDLDGDGDVDLQDLDEMIGHYGSTCG